MDDNKEKIEAGIITKAHGLQGKLKVRSYLENWDKYVGKIMDSSDRKILITESILSNKQKSEYIIAIENLHSINEVQKYLGKKLFVKTSDLEDLEESGEYYTYQLLGLPVLDSKDEQVAIVEQIFPLNDWDFLSLKLNMGNKVDVIFKSEFFSEVKTGEKGYIRITDYGLDLLFK